MKTTRLSLLLAGFASMAAGCQPETETPEQAPTAMLGSHEAALATPVGTWTRDASSLSAHRNHTATLMRGTGDVLVTDGSGAEVYNPYTNVWRRTASLGTARYYRPATELASGKILVSGGRTSDWSTLFSSAELYDPATETWSPTGSMATPRAGHSSTLLDSGKVLVVGGNTPVRGQAPQAEVYDPETGTWSGVSGAFTPRARVSATVLYSGKVLVTGGYLWWTSSSNDTSAEANIYDPATNSWSPAGSLARARHGHFAIRLYSGNVLIVGGIGGGNTVELYDPYNGTWSLAPPFPFDWTPLFSATMLYSGEVLVTDASGQAALYDPTTNTWLPAPNMNQHRFDHTATLLHTGQVLMVGGDSSGGRTVERFTR
ncbi:Kelch repeat-containing protein [Archangium lipolyticum]|uniref:Kelch repeat-containing protein n=1 Tax=Archangium lipolyticum TaxID=2970465 RepID=UPI00214A12CC|nr:kelch motif-containing protein [Archangium lipolyticum]